MQYPIICLDKESASQAAHYAEKYGFVLMEKSLLRESGFHLCINQDGLLLRQVGKTTSDVQVDFVSGAVAHRRRFGGGSGQSIAKAVGISSHYKPSVLDATAGLGRDAFVLATLGCQVQAYERHPVVAALLDDGLKRAFNDDEVAEIVRRIKMHFGVSYQEVIANSDSKPDVIYLDPMFEHDSKQSAAVKKDMQAFRSIVQGDNDTTELINWALETARCRVVVKRARKAPVLGGHSPSYKLEGKANRFDVYALAKVAPP